jgi:UDP-N-acetylglucosamine--N-acetylmuramyl-(pentapeptide) pyrophosphoryl-undecaprenol N-acetylglucosamine transferase
LRKIYFAVFGSGLGHVTRVFDLSERLRANGDEFRFSCSAQALNYLAMVAGRDEIVPSPHLDVEWTEEGSFSSRDFILHFPSLFNSFLKQLAFESKSIPRFTPDVVVSDSRLSAVLAARERSIPIVTMLNQFRVTFPPRFRVNRSGRLYERIAGDVLGLLWSLSDQVLMTDLPPPFTIGAASFEGNDVAKVVRYVGFTSPRLEVGEERLSKARRLLGMDARPLVFFQISGPEQTKKVFVDAVLRSTPELARRFNVVVSIGTTGGAQEPVRLSSGAWLYEWCPIKDELFAISELVVARSGHRTIGQCIDAGKPAVLIPIRNHSEQIGNADRFRELGLGVEIRSEELTPAGLTLAVEECLNDPAYARRARALMAVSNRYDGLGNCAEIIKSYA